MEEQLYIQIFYYFLLIVLLIIPLLLALLNIERHRYNGSVPANRSLMDFVIYYGIPIVLISYITYYIGSRDLNIGVDTIAYWYKFDATQRIGQPDLSKDLLFDLYVYLFAKTTSFNIFLFFSAIIYIVVAYISFNMIFKKYVLFAILIFLISPCFFQFGINVMRNGMAASLFLLGIGMHYKKYKLYLIPMIMSVFFHISMVAPLVVFFFTKYVKSTKIFISIWCIFLLLTVLGVDNSMSQLIFSSGFIGSRLETFTDGLNNEQASWISFFTFRALPIFVGCYFLFVRKFEDSFFIQLLNCYILLNILYLVMFSHIFSLRFSYLSEFMTPILLIYPFIYGCNWKLKSIKLSVILLFVFLFKAFPILIL